MWLFCSSSWSQQIKSVKVRNSKNKSFTSLDQSFQTCSNQKSCQAPVSFRLKHREDRRQYRSSRPSCKMSGSPQVYTDVRACLRHPSLSQAGTSPSLLLVTSEAWPSSSAGRSSSTSSAISNKRGAVLRIWSKAR